ncbi:MAG: hypothetical protein ACT4PT_13510 [Methanobacteriota archaeon]
MGCRAFVLFGLLFLLLPVGVTQGFGMVRYSVDTTAAREDSVLCVKVESAEDGAAMVTLFPCLGADDSVPGVARTPLNAFSALAGDTPPVVETEGWGARSTTEGLRVSARGRATDADWHDQTALGGIERVEAKVLDAARRGVTGWRSAAAADGAFDSGEEEWSVAITADLQSGAYYLTVRAFDGNVWGRIEPQRFEVRGTDPCTPCAPSS